MPAPLHVAAYEAFNARIADRLEASIAFRLFLESEKNWAQGENPPPTEAQYQTFHEFYLRPDEIGRYHAAALALLAEHGTKIVEAKRQAFLEDALAEYQNAASTGHRRFRWKGVWEAMLGALAWTIVLIGFSIILAWTHPDIFDYFKKASRIFYPQIGQVKTPSQ